MYEHSNSSNYPTGTTFATGTSTGLVGAVKSPETLSQEADDLAKQLQILQGVVNELESRLLPVLRPEKAQGEQTASEPYSLLQKYQHVTRGMVMVRQRLEGILGRLEV